MPNKLEVEFSMQKWQWRETIPMPTNAKRYCKIQCREKIKMLKQFQKGENFSYNQIIKNSCQKFRKMRGVKQNN